MFYVDTSSSVYDLKRSRKSENILLQNAEHIYNLLLIQFIQNCGYNTII